jgi:cytoskeletal protein RodZ
MWENEFEKKVHQKMDGFKLRPASAVWEQVERRIRKEKKRRFIFWWFLVSFLLIGGIGAGLWYNNQQTTKTAAINTAPQQDKTVSAIPSSTIPLNTDNRISDSNQLPVNNSQHTNDIIINPSIDSKNNSNSDKKATPAVTNLNAASQPGTSVLTAGEGNRKKTQQKTEKEISAKVKNTDVNVQTPVVTGIKIIPPNPVNEDTASSMAVVSPPAARIQKDLLDEKTVLINDSNSKEPPVLQLLDTAIKATVANKDKKRKGWRWGISIATGRSATVNPIGFGAKKLNTRLDAFGTPPFQNPNASANAPSGLRYGSSFNAGAFIQKQVSKKGQVQINAGYSYLSARMNIGKRIDSVRNISNFFSNGVQVNNFYRPGDSFVKKSYNNQYHFLYLSANFSWRIINGKKFKMDWKNGIQYSYLFGSTMLHYDNVLPGYYQDDNRLVKSGVSVSTGLLIPLTDRLAINPFTTYSLTPVLKKTSSTTIHYTDFGIRLQFLLNKK